MGSILDKIQEAQNGTSSGPTVSAKFREKYPVLAAMLEGTIVVASGGSASPWTLNLFADEDQVRFAISNRETEITFFGSAGNAADCLAGVDKALALGEVTKKREKPVFGKAKY